MYQRILLTLDGSELARAALPHAVELVRGTDCEVVVLQVIDPMAMVRIAAVPAAYEAGRSLDEVAEGEHFGQEQSAKDEVERAVSRLKEAGVGPARGLVKEGLAGNTILDAAAAEGAEAVLMSTRGHSGLGREITGSVAEYVLRHAGNLAVILVGPRTNATR